MNCVVIFLLFILFATNGHCQSEEEIDYYENLIRDNLEKVESYIPPTYYRDFEILDEDKEAIDFGTYDFIIVGGGTAGSLLANRLSEVTEWSVLILEAGGVENDFTDIPKLNYYSFSSDYNWGFNTTVQSTGCKVSDVVSIFPRGKGLGGCSLIHGNTFSRGTASDYNKWAEEGLEGWSFKEVLPYFKKFENATGLKGIDEAYHGFDGPLTIENYKNTSTLSEAFVESLKTFGYNVIDYNGKDPVGVGYIQKSTKSGRRLSAAGAFLRPIEDRINLKIQINALVTRVLLQNRTATGVEFIFQNNSYVAHAESEVIISAGTVQTPQILILSGIGPEEEISKLGIPLVKNLPVGENLKDQYTISIQTATNSTKENIPARSIISQYLNEYGPLTTLAELVAFYKSNSFPITEILVLTDSGILTVNDTLEFSPPTSLLFYISLLHPQSTGWVRVASKDPLQFPLINPNYVIEEDDVQSLIETAEFVVKVLESSEYLKNFNLTITQDTANCGDFQFKSKDYWKCVIQCSGGTASHPSGTCRMGEKESESVVNERLLVHGFENLRVVDASVIPFTITGHMFATVFMIAEKAADIIKEDHYKICSQALTQT